MASRKQHPLPRRDVTDAELAVLEALWSAGQATIRELADELYPEGKASEYATVQKLLDRLEDKGCVQRRQLGRANLFSPRIDRAELIRHRLQETANRLCGGSLTPLLTQLVDAATLTPDELAQLRRLVEEHGRPERS